MTTTSPAVGTALVRPPGHRLTEAIVTLAHQQWIE